MKNEQWTPARIRTIRHAAGLTQTELAHLVGGLTRGAVAHWECGARMPWAKHRHKLEALERQHTQ